MLALTASTSDCIFAATAAGSDTTPTVTGVSGSALTAVIVVPGSTPVNVFVDDDTVYGLTVPMLSFASCACWLTENVPAPVKENSVSAPVVLEVTCRPTSVGLICTTAAERPSVLALIAAAASAMVWVPPIVMVPLVAPFLSLTVRLEAP